MSSSPVIPCIICGTSLPLRTARGRKSGKPFLMLLCPQDGRHFRGFINDQVYVKRVLAHLEGHTLSSMIGRDVDINSPEDTPSKTNLEWGSLP